MLGAGVGMAKFGWVMVLLIACVAPRAWSAEKKGVKMPDQITEQGHTLVLNGLGVRKVTIVSVYVAGLYLERATQNADEIMKSSGTKRLVLHFVMNVSQGQIRDAWSSGFAKNCTTDCNAFAGEIQTLNGWMTDMKNGDEMAFVLSNDGVTVTVKGALKGTITKAGLPQRFLSLFLGPTPPNKGLKDGLLGLEK
jgi:hypothetical protein